MRVPSASSTTGQQDIFDLAGSQLATAGFTIRADPAAPRRYLLAHTPQPGPMLLFVCHVDTVPAVGTARWTHDPLSGELVNGRIVGRGSSDMKSGLAAAVTALVNAQRDHVSCGMLLTADEEIGCQGARAAAEALRTVPVGAVIIPESTSNEVTLGHRGALWLRLTARGRAAHGSTPELGRNALLELAATLLDIDACLPRRQHKALGTTTVNVGTMTAGSTVNIVPDLADASLDIRYIDADEPAAIQTWLATEHPRIEARVQAQLPPVLSRADDSWIRTLPAATAAHPAAPYFTDASALAEVLPGRPIVIWGPGQPEQAHAVNESVDSRYIQCAVQYYGRALAAWQAAPPTEVGDGTDE
ncbi:MAG: M20 family metallopeptidase [Streptosporangiaceae bacterium]